MSSEPIQEILVQWGSLQMERLDHYIRKCSFYYQEGKFGHPFKKIPLSQHAKNGNAPFPSHPTGIGPIAYASQ